jgi:transmembrane protein EpsG
MFAFVLYSAMFYHFFSITGTRQTIATAASFWGFDFIKKKKLLPFIILIMLASTIHRSVLLFLPFYFLINLKKANFIYKAAIFIFPLAMIYRKPLAIIMAKASGSWVYLNYALSDYKASAPIFTALIILLVIVGLIFMRYALNLNPDVSPFYTAIALSFIFTPLIWVDPSFMRVVQYFSIFMVFFIPKIIDIVTLSDQRIKTAIYVCIYLILIFLVIKNGGEYKFFWQEMDLGENYL